MRRFVRLEKRDPAVSNDPKYPHISSAQAQLTREHNRLQMVAEAGRQSAVVKNTLSKIKTLKRDLEATAQDPASDDVQALMKKHTTSSRTSPFLSGTPTFTVGQNSQESYLNAALQKGAPAVVLILHTKRAISNPFNTREHELLLPVGEQKREVVGTFKKMPDGTSTYTDKSGNDPVVHTGQAAEDQFRTAAGRQDTQD
ncbi:membrane protein (plasmid) [Ralstonia solanacearum]|nr:membrane protein [Ralstonia solanacearum]